MVASMGKASANGRVDVFVSYAGPDRPWAEWAGQQLLRSGLSVELDVWDWAPGDNFVTRMSDALGRAAQVLALFSPDYFAPDRFTVDEWTAVMAQRPDERGRQLVPVRVKKVTPPPLLRPLLYRDLFDLSEEQARRALLEAMQGPSRPAGVIRFPGAADPVPPVGGVRVPGSLPPVWNVRRRNPAFTGRSRELAGLRKQLRSGERALVQALQGIGGVGKTELAVEYAHLFGNEYDLVWWIDAERPELIAEQLATLAEVAGWSLPGAAAPGSAAVVLRRLQREPGWLLIYDNAETVDAVADLIPDGGGHVVITSRSSQSGGVSAAPIAVDVLDRQDASHLVRALVPALSDGDAARLAAAVGDLPLAVQQAAGLLAETGMSVGEYRKELAANPGVLLEEGSTGRYPRSLAAVVTASLRHLSDRDEAAGLLMGIVAVLAPEPVPLAWLTDTLSGVLPGPLAVVAASTIARRRMLGRLAAFGLARVDTDTLQVHRLTQAVIAATSDRTLAEHADRLLVSASPLDERDPALWPEWAALVPHLIARAPTATSHDLRMIAGRALLYLGRRGEFRTALALGSDWYQLWQQAFGADDPAVLLAAHHVANSLHGLGDYGNARRLNEDTFARRRRVFGDDHPETLHSASNLAIDVHQLGQYEQARRLNEDTLARRRKVLGDDHRDTLISAGNLAADLHALGEFERARRLEEDTLARRRRVLGADHPETLHSANNFAIDLRNRGEYGQARRLNEDTLARRRKVLGDDHPGTLMSANNLALDLCRLGEYEQARRLYQDVLDGRRRVLGENHPDTLNSADKLASVLYQLSEFEQSRQLREDVGRRGQTDS
jgi:tetratricopeptide (TPR) repeat protein